MAPSTRRNQPRQARLTFSPLSPSPKSKDAYVRFQSPRKNVTSPLASRSQRNDPKLNPPLDSKARTHTLPTPERSSQPGPNIDAAVHSSPSPENTISIITNPQVASAVEEDEEDIIPSTRPKRRKITHETERSDAAGMHTPQQQASSAKKRDNDNSSTEPQSRKSNRLLEREKLLRRSSTSSSVSVVIVSPQKEKRMLRSSSSNNKLKGQPTETLGNGIQFSESDLGTAETSGDEEDAIVTKPTPRRQGRKAVRSADDFVVDDDRVDYSSDSEDPGLPRSSRRSRNNRNSDTLSAESASQDEESDGNSTTPSKKHQVSARDSGQSEKRRRLKSLQEAEDLAEDLEDLHDSAQQVSRTRGKAVTTERDRQLKLLQELKQRRDRKEGRAASESENEDHDEEDFENNSVENDLLDQPRHITISDSEASSSAASRAVRQRQSAPTTEAEDLDAEEEDFVVSDPEDDTLGAPTALPFEFSRLASAKPREHFKNVVEWLVKNKLAPAFSRQDEIFEVAMLKIDDEVSGQAGSRFKSSAWNKAFGVVLDARPQLALVESSGSGVLHETCEACNRSNHPAKWELQFTGEAYNKNTLEPIEKEDEDEDEADGENEDSAETQSIDMKGNALPSQDRCFYLGRFCAANAEMAHKLSHWKWHLNDWLLDFLRLQGVLDAEAIVARENLSQKKRELEAEKIVDGMESNGEMDRLWKDFKADKESAREGMVDHGGGRSRWSGKVKRGDYRMFVRD
ncbi:MAG: hypothetical protein Q9227_002758 [Pyrenula ochraceoflavens]